MDTMVSIIVPTYNREKVIKRAIDSILRQTYSFYEVIVVDDGSTDETGSVIAGIQDSRIRYIVLEENKGVAHARNVGIREARFDYIAFLDSDDEWMSDKLELQMKKMAESSDKVGMVYCRMGGMLRDGTGRFVCPHQELGKEVLEGGIFYSLLYQNVIGTPAMLVVLRIARWWEVGFVDRILVEVHKLAGSISTNAAWYLIARCYMVSLYRQEMTVSGILADVKKEILEVAEDSNLYDEVKELLTREIEL